MICASGNWDIVVLAIPWLWPSTWKHQTRLKTPFNKLPIMYFSFIFTVRQCGSLPWNLTTESSRWLRNNHCQRHLFGEAEGSLVPLLQPKSVQASIEIENTQQITANLCTSSANSSAASTEFKHIRRYDERTVSLAMILLLDTMNSNSKLYSIVVHSRATRYLTLYLFGAEGADISTQ